MVVHAPKTKVDGITRYLENSSFYFDHTFHENDSTETVYKYTVQPLVAHAFRNRGRGTCFAYGQTGSGKTHTMSGIQKYVARDVFRAIQSREFRNLDLRVYVSFYEIYGGRAFDVLHGKNPVIIRENEKQRVVAVGLKEVYVDCEKTLYDVIEAGNASRTTHSTEVNSQSSRSHAICEITVRYPPTASSIDELGDIHGSVGLIDLAGSERAADSRNHNQARRIESAEINKSLLALKECIRALAQRAANPDDPPVHVPFRASKLTLALRDSFTTSNTRVVMIAAVAPGAAAWDHTGNTLKYADRVKERPNAGGRGKADDQAVTFSFLQSDAVGSGAERRAQAAERDRESERRRGGRNVDVSPMHAEDRENGIITGAKSPPKAIFTRMGIEQQRAAAAAADGARAVVPKAQRANPRRVEAGIRSRSSSASWDENFMDVEEGDDHGNGANVGVYGNRGRGTGRRDEYSMPPDYGNLEDFLDENQRGSRHTQPRQQQQQQGNVQGLTESVLSRKSSRYSVTDDSPLPHAPHRRLSYQSEDEESDSLAEKVLVRGERKADVLHTPRSKHRGGDGAPGFSVHPPAGAAGAQSRDGRAAAAGASGGVGLRGAGGRIEQKEKEPVLENSPQRDIQLLHETLRREQPFTAAAQSGDDLLALHEAVDLIVDQEQSLLDAHMEAIQENAQLLTEEGQLLALMQGESGLEHDLSEYAEKLEVSLECRCFA